MDLSSTARQLAEIERKTLLALSETDWKTVFQLAETASLPADSVRRSLEWLKEKQLIETKEEEQQKLVLSKEGLEAFQKGLPEIRLLDWIEDHGPVSLEETKQKSGLKENEFNVALGWNKKNSFVSVAEGKIRATGLAQEEEFEKKLAQRAKALSMLEHKGEMEKEFESEFLQRKLIEKKETREKRAKLNENGVQVLGLLGAIKTRSYNIQNPVPELLVGKKHPYIQFLNQIRRKLTELGFVEMESPLITQEFYNFDVLFQPQNHPARSWTDTYQLKKPKKGKLPAEKIVKAVKEMHETGGISASSGWQYSWEQEIASKVMPTAHTTAHSARQLVKGIKAPGKYFSIARCYRPDVVDATHLAEFNQMEGFLVGEELNFKHLLGILKQFAVEFAGTEEVKFHPSYYPFTEPSCELSVKHPEIGWIELGGAGMFRPEMLENLGIKGQALAWGIGIDRLAMIKMKINDIRRLFSDDLNWLRKMPFV